MDFRAIPSPCFVLEEERLIANLELLARVQQQAGVDIILAFKGFAMWSVFPKVREYLQGATASSLHEAKLCMEEMGVKPHTYCVAYDPAEFKEIAAISSHLTFNSLSQWERYRDDIPADVQVGLRVNPEWSDVTTDLYNPANAYSRLGITQQHLKDGLPRGISGLHFHVLCESDSRALEKVLDAFEQRFGHLLSHVNWVNMGGGHLITRKGYDIEHLTSLLRKFQEKHNVQVILEPGSAVAWQTGDLFATILDIVENNGVKTIIPDISFTCHMPDCLEMPYRPEIIGGSATPDETPFQYRIGGVSCLAGDFLSTYSFEQPPKIGDRLIFKDMIHYTMVKTTTFNGVRHPSIGISKNGTFHMVREFGYDDYKNRLS